MSESDPSKTVTLLSASKVAEVFTVALPYLFGGMYDGAGMSGKRQACSQTWAEQPLIIRMLWHDTERNPPQVTACASASCVQAVSAV